MKYEVDFNYEQGSDYGTGTFTLIKNNEYYDFDFEFTAIQDRDCSYTCHSFSQELPDEEYYEYDVIDKITDLNVLVQRIKKACNEDISEDELDNLIGEEFYKKMSKERYLYTREG